jgi:hypothetical protein
MVRSVDSASRWRRFRKMFLANIRDIFPNRRPYVDRFEVLVVLLFTVLLSAVVTLLSAAPLVEAVGTGWGIVLIAVVAFTSGPLILGSGTLLIFAFMTFLDILMDETAASYDRRRNLRYVLERLRAGRRALRRGWEGLDDARHAYGALRRVVAPEKGLWAKFLYLRATRRQARLGRRITSVYHDSLSTAVDLLRKNSNLTSTDTTPVVWRNPYPLRSLEMERLLEEHVTFDNDVLEETRRPVGLLLFTPRWVFDLVAAGRYGYDERLFYPGMRRPGSRNIIGPAVALNGANPEMVEKLYEPGGSGPMSDLQEVVEAALLLN